jgi:hypothetical protein
MANDNTLTLIEAKTLTSTAASITFSAIPQTYTDLKILVSARDDRSGQPNTDLSLRVGYNGTINTGSIYSNRQLYGNGSATGSQSSVTNYAYLGMATGATATANTFGNTEIYIANYTSANYKSVSTDGLTENNASDAWAVLNANRIDTTNPITDIQISAVYGSGLYQIGSTFYLYGVKSSAVSGTKATGGAIYQDDSYFYHVFSSSGVFTPTLSISADILVVAGGGGGGNNSGAGGGAGGLLGFNSQSLTATGYAVTVGAGGVSATTAGTGSNGSNSQFASLTASVGGGGGGGGGVVNAPGNSGGSGGGGGGRAGGSPAGGTGTSGQGNAGGTGPNTNSTNPYGGGGGAGAAGGNGFNSSNGYGGVGSSAYSSWGLATGTGENVDGVVYYAGGGGSETGQYQGQSPWVSTLNGGFGGGGGSYRGGMPGTGGGAGGNAAAIAGTSPRNGGSGIVIVRYAK